MQDDLDKALAKLRQGKAAPVDDMDAALAKIRGTDPHAGKPRGFKTPAEIEAANAADPERQRSFADNAGAFAQTFADASTFGAAGLVTDALSPGSFSEDRAERKANRAALPAGARAVAEITGSLATPLGGIKGAIAGMRAARSLNEARVAANLIRPGAQFVGSAAQGAGRAAKVGRAVADAGAQAGMTGAVENLDEATPEGVGHALASGARSAALGGAIAPVAGAVVGGATRLGGRLSGMKPLDKKAFEIADAMEEMDKVNYGAALQDAHPTSHIRDVLDSKTVKPFADMVRSSEQFADAPDPVIFHETYKLMSRAQRAAGKRTEGTAEHLAEVELKQGDIGMAKDRMLAATEMPDEVVTMGRARSTEAPQTAQSPAPSVRDAVNAMRDRSAAVATRGEGTVAQQRGRQALERHDAENVVSPSLRGAPEPQRAITRESETVEVAPAMDKLRAAILAHRTKAGELNALERGADVGARVMGGKSVRGDKLRVNSLEKFLRDIPQMTPAEAEAAYAGVLGRGPEQIHLSANPLGGFGALSSMARAPIASVRAGPLLKALEQKIGRNVKAPKIAESQTRGLLARLIGLQGNRE